MAPRLDDFHESLIRSLERRARAENERATNRALFYSACVFIFAAGAVIVERVL